MEFYSIMDQKDIKILGILNKNARLSSKEISKKVGLPITTVHNRIKRMEKSDIIIGYNLEINYKKLERGLSIYLLVSCDIGLLKEKKKTQYDVAGQLKNLSYVEKVDIVIGGTDIIVYLRVKDIDEFDRILLKEIHKIEGINNTTTSIVLHEV